MGRWSLIVLLGLVCFNSAMAEPEKPFTPAPLLKSAGTAKRGDVPVGAKPGMPAVNKDSPEQLAERAKERKNPPARWSAPGGWADEPLAAAMLPTVGTMQAMAATIRNPIVSELVAPAPWALESCGRWRKEGWDNCMRTLDADTRRLLWRSVTWIEDVQIDRAKRGSPLAGLRLHPSQAKEILEYCGERATAWAQASNKSC
jgi:hypothetical protein